MGIAVCFPSHVCFVDMFGFLVWAVFWLLLGWGVCFSSPCAMLKYVEWDGVSVGKYVE